jgi:large conductance mechanosensitive channel
MDKKEKAKGIIKEFKDFISRGNVIDMAVGVIIGGAFGKIVTSIVDDILMPIIGAALGGLDFRSLVLTVGSANIAYGNFLQNVVDFLIVAACIFIIINAMNKFKKKEEPKEEAPKKSDEVLLLEEIRDLLKKK